MEVFLKLQKNVMYIVAILLILKSRKKKIDTHTYTFILLERLSSLLGLWVLFPARAVPSGDQETRWCKRTGQQASGGRVES